MIDEFDLPADWNWVKFQEVCLTAKGSIVSGPFGSSIGSRFFVEAGVPVIRGNNLSLGAERFIDDGYVFLTEDKAVEFKNCYAIPGDIIFTAAGSIGQVGLIPPDARFPIYVISNKQIRARINPLMANEEYVYYWLSCPEMVQYIQQRNTGSSVPLINLSIVKALPIPLPPLAEQRAIAGILGALDDKIALNRQMNATLESLARALFQSWFVDFDPVRAKAEGRTPDAMDAETAALFPASFEDSPLGPIPSGWRVGTLGEVADNPRRSVNPLDVPAGIPYIGLEHMPQRSIALPEWGTGDDVESNKYLFTRGEFLFGKLRPYFHKVGIAPTDGICSTDILVVVPKAGWWGGFVLFHISSDEFVSHTTTVSTGTRMPRTNWRDMSNYPVVVPPSEVAGAFNALVLPMLETIVENVYQSRTLAETRDALLPKLVSGALRVGDLNGKPTAR